MRRPHKSSKAPSQGQTVDVDIDQAASCAYELGHKFHTACQKATWVHQYKSISAMDVVGEFFNFLTKDTPGSLVIKMTGLRVHVDQLIDQIQLCAEKEQRYTRANAIKTIVVALNRRHIVNEDVAAEIFTAFSGQDSNFCDFFDEPEDLHSTEDDRPDLDVGRLLKKAHTHSTTIEQLSSSTPTSPLLQNPFMVTRKGLK